MLNNFTRAKSQSKNLIIDLRRYGKPDIAGINEALFQFQQKKTFVRLKIIKKDGTELDYQR